MKHSLIILGIVFVFGLLLRSFSLAEIPLNIHTDEVNVGYVGYKIVQTGSDIYGNFFPLYINKFGDFRPAGIFYILGIFTSLFGLSTFTLRFPTALIGALTIVSVYFLTCFISNNKKISLLASFLLAVSPWHIVVSRATSEQVVALFLLVSGAALMLKGVSTKKISILIFSFIVMFSSYFFYHSPRVFLPAFLFLFFIFGFLKSKTAQDQKKLRKVFGLLLVTVLILTALISFTEFGSGRFGQTSIFSNPDIVAKIQALSDVDKGNILEARVFHNKPLVYAKEIKNLYLSYFSTEFLYIKGGLPERYVVPEHGLFYYIELPFLIAGFYFLVRRRPRFYFLPLIWIICGPLAASLTLEDSPNIQRALFMLPAFQIIEAYGIYFVYYLFKGVFRYLYVFGLTVVLAGSMVFFFHQYSVHASVHYAFLRNAGMMELFSDLKTREDNFDQIYVSSVQDIPMYFFFYNHKSYPQLKIAEGQKDFTVGKYHFVNHECPEVITSKEKFNEKTLVVSYYGCENVDFLQNIDSTLKNDDTQAFILRQGK